VSNRHTREQQVRRHRNKDKSPLEHKRASTFVARAGALPINGSDAEAIPSLSPFPFLLFYDASWAHEPPGMVSARPQKDVTQHAKLQILAELEQAYASDHGLLIPRRNKVWA